MIRHTRLSKECQQQPIISGCGYELAKSIPHFAATSHIKQTEILVRNFELNP